MYLSWLKSAGFLFALEFKMFASWASVFFPDGGELVCGQ